MSKKLPLWFGVYGKEYHIDEPAFFEEDILPWANELKQSYPEIKEELSLLMAKGNDELKPYFGGLLQFPKNTWKTTGFYFWGKKSKLNKSNFPKTTKALLKIPGLTTASFNLLEPNSRILPYFGETNATYRVHFCISSPGELPECGFRVKNEKRSWENGEILVFSDANEHEAFNFTNKPRYILLIEVIRPGFMHLKKSVCLKALAILSLYFILGFMGFTKVFSMNQLKKILKMTPDVVINLLIFPFKMVWFVNLKMSKFFKLDNWVV